MLYACECWPLKQMDLDWLLRNERAMLPWICAVKPTDVINTQDLRLRLSTDNLDVALRQKHLRWFGHVQRAHHGLEGFVPWMLVDVSPVAGQERPGVRS